MHAAQPWDSILLSEHDDGVRHNTDTVPITAQASARPPTIPIQSIPSIIQSHCGSKAGSIEKQEARDNPRTRPARQEEDGGGETATHSALQIARPRLQEAPPGPRAPDPLVCLHSSINQFRMMHGQSHALITPTLSNPPTAEPWPAQRASRRRWPTGPCPQPQQRLDRRRRLHLTDITRRHHRPSHSRSCSSSHRSRACP